MSDTTDKHKSEKWAQRIAGGITALSVIFAAAVHTINFLPGAYSTVFPKHDIRLLGFNSKERLLLANRGDYDYFLSHVRYGPDYTALASSDVAQHATQFLESNVLRAMCESAFSDPNSHGTNVDCEERLGRVSARLDSLPTKSPELDAPAPGFKNRGVAQVLPREVTRQFDIKDSKWGKCPVVKNAGDEEWRKLLAFWLTTYQTMPGQCTKLEFYYVQDRNFIALAGLNPGLNIIPAIGSLHYYPMNKQETESKDSCAPPAFAKDLLHHAHSCGDSDSEECAVHPACLSHKELTAIAGVLHYNDSHFCADAITKITGFDGAIPRSGDKRCLQGK